MNPTDFLTSVTREIRRFTPNGTRFENTETGALLDQGTIVFECGHSYLWSPWALGADEPMPAAGGRMVCGMCIEDALAALKAS